MTSKKLLKYLNKKTKSFLSTGMSNIKEISQSLKYLNNTEVVIMHCVSEYPLKAKFKFACYSKTKKRVSRIYNRLFRPLHWKSSKLKSRYH